MKKYVAVGIVVFMLIVIIGNSKKEDTKTVLKGEKTEEKAGLGITASPFGKEKQVTIEGYDDHAMEPFLSRDGEYLFWNSLNDAKNTSLYYAKKVNDTTFKFVGSVGNVNGKAPHLDAVASMDTAGHFYWVSLRDYPSTLENFQYGIFKDGAVTGIEPVKGGIYTGKVGWLIMDAEISPDGNTLYYVDAKFSGKAVPDIADIAVADKVAGTFTKNKNSETIFNTINTEKYAEYAPSVTKDGLELFFTRLYGNKTVIYYSTRKSVAESFGEPVALAIPGSLPEAVTVSLDGTRIYYHKKVGSQYRLYTMKRNL